MLLLGEYTTQVISCTLYMLPAGLFFISAVSVLEGMPPLVIILSFFLFLMSLVFVYCEYHTCVCVFNMYEIHDMLAVYMYVYLYVCMQHLVVILSFFLFLMSLVFVYCKYLTCVCVCIRVCMYVCMYEIEILCYVDCIHVSISVCMHVCMHACMHIDLSVCMYVYT